MKQKKYEKGEFGYLPYERKVVIMKTILLFIIALIIFFTGYLWTKTKANIFSIIAVLALLPASRSTVSMIMYLKTPTYKEEVFHRVHEFAAPVVVLFQLYLTSYQKNFPISCFAIRGNHLIGYTEFGKCDVAACEQHIQDILKQNAVKNVTIKIFTDINKFEDRIEQLKKFDEHPQDAEIMEYLKDISL